jgi:hypothetical protein
VGIDLSGTTAALDVVVDQSYDLDPNHICIPEIYEAVNVEQDVIETIEPDDTGLSSF